MPEPIPNSSYQDPKKCKAKLSGNNVLHVRTHFDRKATLVASVTNGTELGYVDVVQGEKVVDENYKNGNSNWARSSLGFYFWLGATDHPTG